MKSKLMLLLCSVLTVLGLSVGVCAAEVQTVTASVDYNAQAGGAFIVPPCQGVEVSSDLAESYGFVDTVPAGENVSALDVLVRVHLDLYGESFTAETAGNYLEVPESGWITKLFGTETYSSGFTVNDGCPNDGIATEWGYTSTTVNQTAVENGDELCFYIYQDVSAWSDIYAFIDAPASAYEGEAFTVTIKGFSVMSQGAMYATVEELKAHSEAVAGAQLALVDDEGKLTDIEGAVTDEKGEAELELAGGSYMLVAYMPEAEIAEGAAPLVMDVACIEVSAKQDNAGNREPEGSVNPVNPAPADNTPVATTPVKDIFKDIKEGSWYYGDIQYVYDNGIMVGTAKDAFSPGSSLTRAMFVAMLYRMAGSPEVSSKNIFTDVPAGKYYTDAVIWVYANGVVAGTSADEFSPKADITREQMVAMMMRYADKVLKADVSAKAELDSFKDAASVSSWARDAFGWSVQNSIIVGDNGMLRPGDNATRAQAAAVFHRFTDKY